MTVTLPHLFLVYSELSGSQETLKPKRDPSRKVHIYRAGQVPGWANDEERVELPQSKSKHKSKIKAAIQRARAEAEEGTARCGIRASATCKLALVREGPSVFEPSCAGVCHVQYL